MKARIRQYLVGFSLLVAFITGRVPVLRFRHFMYRRVFRMVIGKDSTIHWRLVVFGPHLITIGKNVIIGNDCFIDGRFIVTFGNNINVGDHVHIYSGQHDPQTTDFGIKFAEVRICDHVYLGARCTILPGVTVGEGAVVAAGAVVHRDVEPYTMVGGVPARFIKERRRDLDYTLKYHLPFQ